MEISQLYQLYLQCGGQVTTDSRHCPPGSIFVALKGASFDGNRFAAAALEKGCAYAIVDEKEWAREGDSRYILTDDALVAYKELAREHRRRFHFPVIGITGTNGKTTTKELVAAVLAEKYNVVRTEANYNNDVGVPRTLLSFRPDHDIAVVEMGASHPGDIEKLVTYVEPTCGLITNVGRAHLQGFGSFEGVKKTKGELYDWLSQHDALLFLNIGDPDLAGMASRRHFRQRVTYAEGFDRTASVCGEVIACDPFLRFRWRKGDGEGKTENENGKTGSGEWETNTRLIGAYNLANMLAAIAVGLHFGVSPDSIVHALEAYQPSNDRSQLTVTAKNRLIVDAYNANPTSMGAALDNFGRMDVSPKMAILGDMRELGDASEEEHRRVVDMLRRLHFDKVWLVGSEFLRLDDCPFRRFRNVEEVEAAIRAEQPEGYHILIKGSNGDKLFLLPALL